MPVLILSELFPSSTEEGSRPPAHHHTCMSAQKRRKLERRGPSNGSVAAPQPVTTAAEIKTTSYSNPRGSKGPGDSRRPLYC